MVEEIKIAEGYKQTEVGVIPDDWDVKKYGDIFENIGGGAFRSKDAQNTGIKWIKIANVGINRIKWDEKSFLPSYLVEEFERFLLKENDYVIALTRPILNKKLKIAKLNKSDAPALLNQRVGKLVSAENNIDFVYYLLQSSTSINALLDNIAGTDPPNLGNKQLYSIICALPPTRTEQTAIATALSDMDGLIQGLEKLLVKKRNIKQGAMQELLKPKEGWEVKVLEEIIDCLDNIRVPLNEEERLKMKGDIPYCGANGIVGYVNDYVIDDNIILIAEDGGYFDEYETRPIAYKINGKCWVNNHAHILKAKKNIGQDFIFYSLVHKNILNHLASGTRAKLNKSELYKISINIPPTIKEQTRIAQILSDMDTEIEKLETQLSKYKMLKTGMMQELLTGKKRLI